MSLNLVILFTFRLCAYFPSKWDEVAKHTPATVGIINTSKGWLREHENKVDVDVFGDLSVFTANFYIKDTTMTLKATVEAVRDILDSVHPSILVLQGIQSNVLKSLRALLENDKKHKARPHYMLTADTKYSTDLINGKNYFLPVIYDKNLMTLRTEPKFYYKSPEAGKVLYAVALEFSGGRLGFFSLINIDLFSFDVKVNEASLGNIVSDIKNEPRINKQPVIFAGTINSMDEGSMVALQAAYSNVLALDEYSKSMSKTTFTGGGLIDDNVQRDFILLRNNPQMYKLSSARIQTLWPYLTDHLPLYAIFTIRTQKTPDEPKKSKAKNKERDALKEIDDEAERKKINEGIVNAINQRPPEIHSKNEKPKEVPLVTSTPKVPLIQSQPAQKEIPHTESKPKMPAPPIPVRPEMKSGGAMTPRF